MVKDMQISFYDKEVFWETKQNAPNTHLYNPIPMKLLLICTCSLLELICLISIVVFLQFGILDL